MKISKIEQGTELWHEERKGHITGTSVKRFMSSRTRDVAKYELLAEKLSVSDGYEDLTPMERGKVLEPIARQEFAKLIGKEVQEAGLCSSDENDYISYSPDGLLENSGVEIKCLNSGVHLKSYFEKSIPKDYEEQVVQSFIVNEKQEKLYFVMYDPRIQEISLHYIEITREELQDKIEKQKKVQVEVLSEVSEMVNQLRQF